MDFSTKGNSPTYIYQTWADWSQCQNNWNAAAMQQGGLLSTINQHFWRKVLWKTNFFCQKYVLCVEGCGNLHTFLVHSHSATTLVDNLAAWVANKREGTPETTKTVPQIDWSLIFDQCDKSETFCLLRCTEWSMAKTQPNKDAIQVFGEDHLLTPATKINQNF